MSCVWAFIKLGALKVHAAHHCMQITARAGSSIELDGDAYPMSKATEPGAGFEQRGVLPRRM